jgi:hypothetical protein
VNIKGIEAIKRGGCAWGFHLAVVVAVKLSRELVNDARLKGEWRLLRIADSEAPQIPSPVAVRGKGGEPCEKLP